MHSVLVHSGDIHSGHYYAFIRPGLFADHWEEEEEEEEEEDGGGEGEEGAEEGGAKAKEREKQRAKRRRRKERRLKNPAWYKFDDETVTRVTRKDAVEANFGGDRSKPVRS